MQQPIRTLNLGNISGILANFKEEVADIGRSIGGLRGVPLLTALKRQPVGHGPYPNVTLFEAANRVMSDLVILEGVQGLLNCEALPFTEYTVEFGNEDKNGFDIRAGSGAITLTGEAFNVAPSFFQGKKAMTMDKLQKLAPGATYKVIMFNSDAVSEK